jgi:hypothetical protein
VWVARYEAQERDRVNNQFVGDAAAAMRAEAFILLGIVGERWDDREKQANVMRQQMAMLKEVISVFQTNVPMVAIMNYRARFSITRLTENLQRHMMAIDAEFRWLSRGQSEGVVQIACEKMTNAAQAIFDECRQVCAALKYLPPLPTEPEIRDRVRELLAD